ncbi:unnamed protein product [Closterium sp. Yama58-4]|nr:unnamed protein product [Closterium sp. Yama58-4]
MLAVSGDGGDNSESDNNEDVVDLTGGESVKESGFSEIASGKEATEESPVGETEGETVVLYKGDEAAYGETVVLYKGDDGTWVEAEGPVAEGVETVVLQRVESSQEEGAGDNREEEAEEEDDEWEFEEEDAADVVPGDGLDGGGFVLNGAAWGQTALELAQEVLGGSNYGGEFELYGFKVYPERNWIRVRLDKLSDVYGSPMVEDIDSFLLDFNALVIAAGERGELPQDIQIEVSSPGAERVVKVPDDLIRFKELPMYVHYRLPSEADNTGDKSATASGGKTSEEILSLVEVDEEERVTIWRVADVRLNRELYGGKGRPLSRKNRERRITVPFADILVVRIYLDY